MPSSLECEKYAGKNIINVSHTTTDVVLQDVQQKVAAVLEIVPGRAALESRLAEALDCAGAHGGGTVDLVAHSTSSGQVLAFGTWEVKADKVLEEFCRRVRARMASPPRGVSVRLIGCGTAGTKEGKEALGMIERELGLPAWGTTTLVMERDFSADGYNGRFLVRGGAKRAPARVALWELPNELAIDPPAPEEFLPSEDTAMREFLLQIFKALGEVVDLRRAYRAKGLLLQPLTSIALPTTRGALERAPGGRRPWLLRADVLFKVRLLRIWPMGGGEGVLYPVRDRQELPRLLHALGGWFRTPA